LADLLNDLTSGFSEGHSRVTTGETEIALFVYTADEELEAEVAGRMSDNF